jgi:hypothetical protein
LSRSPSRRSVAIVQSLLPQTAARLLEDSPWFFLAHSVLESVAVLVLQALPLFIDLPLLSLAELLSSGLAFRRLGIRPLNTAPNHLGRCFGTGFGDLKLDHIILEYARDGEVAESPLAGLIFVKHCRPIGAWGRSKPRAKLKMSGLGVAPYQLELAALDIRHQNHPPKISVYPGCTHFPFTPGKGGVGRQNRSVRVRSFN